MDKLLPLTEQLDRAVVELRLDHPLHNRLALILVDNAVELMVSYSLAVHTSFGGEYPDSLDTAEQRRNARSQRFGDRLAMLVHVKELTQLEADFVLAAHEHRNAAYHEGFGGRPYLRPLCPVYFRFACLYLTRFEMAFHSWVSNFQFTDISRRYYDACRDGDGALGRLRREKLAAMLEAQLPGSVGQTVQEALADEVENDRKAIAESFRFLIENSRPRKPTSLLLKKIQFEHARDLALAKKGLEITHFGTARRAEADQFVKTTWKKYLPRYRAIPHGAWSQRIRRILTNPDPLSAVVQFERLRTDMEFLREAICDAAFDLDMKIQSEYD